ncbi:MAG: DNA repair protein RadC [Bacteroidetes bacterium]|nr:DNA repair protein RadC [Bacteroidota bacterium]
MNMNPAPQRIKQLHEDDRPREKLLKKGGKTLSNSELLAILIGSGNKQKSALDLGKEVMEAASHSLNNLGKFSSADFLKISGLGPAKAVVLLAMLELGRRRGEESAIERKSIKSSRDAVELIRDHLRDLDHEEFWLIMMNRGAFLIDKIMLSSGGTGSTVVDPKMLFRIALQHKTSMLIVAHNHPSGTLKPSEADIKLTEQLKNGAKLLDIVFADHVIIAGNDYYSFADEGKL